MRVLTPAKASRSRASLGGTKRPRMSGGDALAVHEGDGALSMSTSSGGADGDVAVGVRKDGGGRRRHCTRFLWGCTACEHAQQQ